ncbi:MAG: site-2 protease family protein [Chloroflexi bacterium]|nr:site-2 protease family protein [Chloroflexota bacterium]
MLSALAAFLVLSLLMTVHELGHLFVARLVGIKAAEFGLGYPPRLFTLGRIGDTDYTLNLIPFAAFVRVSDNNDFSQDLTFHSHSVGQRFAMVAGGAFMNLLFSAALFATCFVTGWVEVPETVVTVERVFPGSVGAAVGFREGDDILLADETEVSSVLELISYSRSRDGAIRTVEVRRSGRRFAVRLPAGRPWFDRPESRGVTIANRAGWVQIVRYPLLEALWRGFTESIAAIVFVFAIPLKVLQGLIPPDLVRPVGPVGLGQLAGRAALEVTTTGHWFYFLRLVATLSASLAAINLLPLPGLDGGRLAFLSLEIVRRKRMDPAKESLIHLVGLVLMLILLLVVTYQDIVNPLGLKH